MSPRDGRPATPAELRRLAEERVSEAAKHAPAAAHADTLRLVHELRVHQVELELQNEELVRSRAELEAALQKYADLYDFAPIGYFTVGPDSAVAGLNLTAARLLGSERARLVGRPLAAFVAESDRPVFAEVLARALEGGGQASCEVAMAERDGGEDPGRYLQLAASAGPGDAQCRVVALDITERRRAEEHTRSTQRLEAIGQLAGGVAHDFNNLLTVILAHADEALATLGEATPLHEGLVELRAAAQRGAELTRQLLTFGRRHTPRPQVVEVNPLARGLAAMLRRVLGDDIELVLSLSADLGRVTIDPAQLDQALMNLAVNARDAMPDGGTLTVSTANADADERRLRSLGLSLAPGPFVVITVSDTGLGMDGETMAHIFEPFFTTQDTGRRAGLGVGLGLATVYGIVEECGGDVAVDSRLGGGTTFEIYLPRTEAPAAADPTRAASASADVPTRGVETILIVEDEGALRRIAERLLASCGYSVLAAGNGEQALRLAQEHSGPIHLALSDVVMPGMTGPVFAGHLRRAHPEARVLFMSGYPDRAFDEAGLDRATPFIAKPFSAGELRRKVRQVLDARPEPAAPAAIPAPGARAVPR